MLDAVLRINGRKDKIDISVSQSYHVGKNGNSLYQKQINMKEKSRKGKTIKMGVGVETHLKTAEKIHVFLFFKCSKISGINMLYEMNVKHIEYYFKQKWQCSF